MPYVNNISISFSIQQFNLDNYYLDTNTGIFTFLFNSNQSTKNISCPYCNSSYIEISDNYETRLRDMPIWIDVVQYVNVKIHRYRCLSCRKHFTENIGFKYPGSRITTRAAQWVKELIRWHMSISAVHEITGIHWSTICKIQKEFMDNTLTQRKRELIESGYKPTYLAVDEFAIHKGHTYATCVMDLIQGDILWVGKNRTIESFEKFFKEIDMDYLSEVKAVAMDMNASYNTLVEKYLPNADIVYDRYHMQAQFGKDVLGSVRLEEAKEHLNKAKDMDALIENTTDPVSKRKLKEKAKTERSTYTKIKRSRWPLLKNKDNLDTKSLDVLNEILINHDKLATCYAMKEEMSEIFNIHDEETARERWTKWFEAAKSSGIAQLVKFAQLKEVRIKGLVNHAKHRISTGKLEGLNNKIKVSKRIGYGYRNDDYFFTLIRYLSIPYVKLGIPKNP